MGSNKGYNKRQIVKEGCACNHCITATRAKNSADGHFLVADYAKSIIGAIPKDPIDRREEAKQNRREGERLLKIAELYFSKCAIRGAA